MAEADVLSAKPVELGGYAPLFQLGDDETPYRRLDIAGVRTETIGGREFLLVEASALQALADTAFGEINHFLRPGHLQQLKNIVLDPEAGGNDRFIALELLKNAVIASSGVFPMCQDTGTAIISAKKGEMVIVEGDDEAALAGGAKRSYGERNLRYSQMAPLTMYDEVNTKSNLPAQIDIYSKKGAAYDFLFIAKGGGSANKTFLFQQTRRLLEKERLLEWLGETLTSLGTTACPPYHLAVVIGGLSAELTMKTVKMASCKEYDVLPVTGDESGRAFRDLELEEEILELTRSFGIGAQFGGKYFCHDVRVIRLPRHGASLPVGIGVSCSADRQIKAKITREGVFIEALEHDPARFMPDAKIEIGDATPIDLDEPMADICAKLSQLEVSSPVLLSGTMIVARDMVHAEMGKLMAAGKPLPDYMKQHPIYYAGPAKKPDGFASGSFGPTTAARMDPYIPELQAQGASMVMLAKGNRSQAVTDSCKANGGFYLGTVGGAAARVGRDMITHVEVLDFEHFGMEAVWKITVKDLPAFIIVDDKGNDFFKRRKKS